MQPFLTDTREDLPPKKSNNKANNIVIEKR
jgi:hypothetical protein